MVKNSNRFNFCMSVSVGHRTRFRLVSQQQVPCGHQKPSYLNGLSLKYCQYLVVSPGRNCCVTSYSSHCHCFGSEVQEKLFKLVLNTPPPPTFYSLIPAITSVDPPLFTFTLLLLWMVVVYRIEQSFISRQNT